LVSAVIKNWDNKTWLSSKDYIKSFNEFLIKNIKLNSKSKILDVGCGRGKILGNLSSKLNHKDKDKRMKFRKIDASSINFRSNEKFDLILIKQTIHLLKLNDIKRLLFISKKHLEINGKIFVFTLDADKNELPTFNLMKIKLLNSLKKDMKILKLIKKIYPDSLKKKFIFKVDIIKKDYLKMIQKRYISTLLPLTKKELLKGVEEIDFKHKNNIKFNDKLTCLII
jgi:ubiquinone/menaquinone biosynthesis C-methylase UbiE